MHRIDKTKCTIARSTCGCAVVLGLIISLSACGGERDDDTAGGVGQKKHKKAVQKEQFTGDWYDEYAAEQKKKKPLRDKSIPLTAKECVTASRAALNDKDYDKSFQLADAAIKRDPNYGEAFFVRGASIFYSAFGEEKDAIKDLEQSRKLGFRHPELFNVLAKLYDARKEYDKAIEAVTYGMQVSPDKELYRCRASLYETQGRLDLSLVDLTKYINDQPAKSLGYNLRASVYQQLGKNKEALDDYATAIKLNPSNTHAMATRANLLKSMGRNKEALEQISMVADLDKFDDDALRTRGDIYFNLGQYDRAIVDYSQSIKISPEYARASLEARGRAYDKIGKHDLAEKDRAEASKIKDKPAEKPVYDFK